MAATNSRLPCPASSAATLTPAMLARHRLQPASRSPRCRVRRHRSGRLLPRRFAAASLLSRLSRRLVLSPMPHRRRGSCPRPYDTVWNPLRWAHRRVCANSNLCFVWRSVQRQRPRMTCSHPMVSLELVMSASFRRCPFANKYPAISGQVCCAHFPPPSEAYHRSRPAGSLPPPFSPSPSSQIPSP